MSNSSGISGSSMKHLRRTVRQLNQQPNAAHIIQKRYISVRYSSSEDAMTPEVLLCIINVLHKDIKPNYILLLITPASKHRALFKLHVLNTECNLHLGVFSISCGEMKFFKQYEQLLQYQIVISSKFISLLRFHQHGNNLMKLIQKLPKLTKCKKPLKQTISSKNDEDKRLPLEERQPNEAKSKIFRTSQTDGKNSVENKTAPATATATAVPNQQYNYLPQESRIRYTQPEPIYNLLSHDKWDEQRNNDDLRLEQLMQAINSTDYPYKADIDAFFDIAEAYYFKLYVRPVMSWSEQLMIADGDSMDEVLRFYVECFMIFGNYIGRIRIDAETLNNQLHMRPSLIKNVTAISDVYGMTNIPKIFVSIGRTVCHWLHMEFIYDLLGNALFEILIRLGNIRKFTEL